MSITFELPEEVTADLLRRAELAGQTPETYAAEAVRRELATRQLQERQQLADIDWALAARRDCQ